MAYEPSTLPPTGRKSSPSSSPVNQIWTKQRDVSPSARPASHATTASRAVTPAQPLTFHFRIELVLATMGGVSGRKRPTSRGADPRSGRRPRTGRTNPSQGGHERSGWRRFADSTWTITVVGGAAAAVIAAVILVVFPGFFGKVFRHGTTSGPSAPIAVNVSVINPYDGCEGGEGWVIPASPSVRIIENSIRRNIGRWLRGRNQETC
jgi:hypothetical protein